MTRAAGRMIMAVLASAALAGGAHEVTFHTIDGGGGSSVGGTYTLRGTIGQPDAARGSGGTYALVGGYWGVARPSVGPDPCPADLSGNGVVDATDLATLLGGWGPNPGHPGDLDGNGVVGPSDLAALLGTWGACPR